MYFAFAYFAKCLCSQVDMPDIIQLHLHHTIPLRLARLYGPVRACVRAYFRYFLVVRNPLSVLVQVHAVGSSVDPVQPWNTNSQETSSGTGFSIELDGELGILTNAHVVADAKYLEVSRAGDPRKYLARRPPNTGTQSFRDFIFAGIWGGRRSGAFRI